MCKKFLIFCFVFLIVAGWIFSGWPQIWQNPSFPPEVQPANALNQVSNWDFNGGSTGWTYTGDTGTGADSCVGSDTVAEASAETGAYDGTINNPPGSAGSFKFTTPAAKNTKSRGKITRTFSAPGSSTVKVKGRFDYYAVGSSWRTAIPGSSWIRLDLYDSSDSTYVANLACVSFTANQSWTTTSWNSDINLDGGTQYTIRVTFRSYTGSSATSNSLWVDNIIVNAAPVGLLVTAPVNTTNAQLDWTASTGGTGAPGLHATTPYKVYRDESSPVSTFKVNATTNSYTDTSTVGNTLYYYAVSNVDTNSIESPFSAEVSIKTRPGLPGTPTFSDVTGTSITVSWSPPAGGSDDNYYVDRAPDVGGSPGTWVEGVGTNVTSPWVNNTGLTCETTYWYRVRGKNATGYGVYSGNASRTTGTCAPEISISISSDGVVEYDTMLANTSKTTLLSDMPPSGDMQTATYSSTVTVNINIKGYTATGGGCDWTLAGSNGNNQYVHQFCNATDNTCTSPPENYTPLTTGYQPLKAEVIGEGTVDFHLRLTTPDPSTCFGQQSVNVTIQAAQ